MVNFMRYVYASSMTLIVLLAANSAGATAGITYHGRLIKPDGRTAVTSANVQFKIQIRTPGAENCLGAAVVARMGPAERGRPVFVL